MKVGLSIDDELMKRIDDYADDHYMSRSAFVAQACSQALNAYEVQCSINSMAVSMRKIADMGSVDDETLKELENFERLVQLLTGNPSAFK